MGVDKSAAAVNTIATKIAIVLIASIWRAGEYFNFIPTRISNFTHHDFHDAAFEIASNKDAF